MERRFIRSAALNHHASKLKLTSKYKQELDLNFQTEIILQAVYDLISKVETHSQLPTAKRHRLRTLHFILFYIFTL